MYRSIPTCLTERDSKINDLLQDLNEAARKSQKEAEKMHKENMKLQKELNELKFRVAKFDVDPMVKWWY